MKLTQEVMFSDAEVIIICPGAISTEQAAAHAGARNFLSLRGAGGSDGAASGAAGSSSRLELGTSGIPKT